MNKDEEIDSLKLEIDSREIEVKKIILLNAQYINFFIR
jgi:hypothetical protein